MIPHQIAVFVTIALILVQGLSERWLYTWSGSRGSWGRFEATLLGIVIPYAATIFCSFTESARGRIEPHAAMFAMGCLLWAGGEFFRTKGLYDLGVAFSPNVRVAEGQRLVETGLYRRIRHPLYVGSILLAFAWPALLGARWSWIAAAACVTGVFVRLRKEEWVLRRELDGYADYCKRTAALVPWVW